MKRILIIGSGDVALRTLPLLTVRYHVYALVRNPAYCENLRKLGVTPIVGDLDDRASLTHLAGLADAVLHLAPPPVNGATDPRTRNLLAALARGRAPRKLVYISTSGVYGDCGGAWVSEVRPLAAQSPRAQRRVDAEHQVRDWARRNRVNACILRVPGIYAADRLPLDRLHAGSPAIRADEDSYSNHIHADDLARICVAALHRGAACRVYHATDDDQMKMGDYFDAVADAHGLPRPPRMARAEVRERVSPMMWSFMAESRRLTNQRLKRELRVRLQYPTVADFLAKPGR
ncbi:MAG: SDR family oxidoreductase [Gallionella sp.]|nr:SDR family oxidoreductase [Gallionella sp.]MDD4946785.1 SDR family oxidoreductase [Gallionella sp.]MDD5612276.1 SDR family oxidoreductase [Gallionella sp.]